MRRWVLVGTVVLVVLAVAVGGVYVWQRPLLLTGTGYAAHNACAVTEVAGRDDPDADLPPNPLVPVLRTEVSPGSASTSVLGVLARQRAWHSPGFGCAVAAQRPDLPEALPIPPGTNPLLLAAAPSEPEPVRVALDRAFGADLSDAARAALGTRGVVVVKDGVLVAERYAPGFDAGTPQLGWSMTKSVANLVVGRLVHDGRISLDDDRLLPEWTDDRSAITVRDLLQMTSGLAWDETYDLGTPITRMLYGESDMGRYVAGQPLAHQPGTHLQYSSGSTTLLCSILARDHGGPNLPRAAVLAPLGLERAVLETDAAGTPVCSSYLWATPREWASIGQFALDDGVWDGQRLLPAGWLAASARPVDVPGADPGAAAGWWANVRADGTPVQPDLPKDSYFAKGHDGQLLVVVPSERLVVVRLGFTPGPEDDRGMALAAELVTALR